jgi:hypothetical protein
VKDHNQPVKPFHKSFPDFITDPLRCVDTRFFISPQHLHSRIITNCLRSDEHGLEQDLLSLPEYSLNSEVEDLQTRISNRVSMCTEVCLSVMAQPPHQTRGRSFQCSPLPTVFLEEKFLAWLEVVSVLRDVGGAVVALERLVSWLQRFV